MKLTEFAINNYISTNGELHINWQNSSAIAAKLGRTCSAVIVMWDSFDGACRRLLSEGVIDLVTSQGGKTVEEVFDMVLPGTEGMTTLDAIRKEISNRKRRDS